MKRGAEFRTRGGDANILRISLWVDNVQPLYYNIIKQTKGTIKENKQCIRKHLIANMVEWYMD